MNNDLNPNGNPLDPQVSTPTPEPVVNPTPQVSAPTPEPVVNPTPQVSAPTPEPVVNPAPQVSAPTPEPVVNPAPQVSAPTPEPVVNPEPQVSAPTPEPVVNPAPQVGEPNSTYSKNPVLIPKKQDKKPLIIGIVIGVLVFGIIVGIALLGGKKVVCTISEQQGDNMLVMTTTLKQKSNYIDTTVNLVVTNSNGFSESDINQLKETLEESYKNEDSFKIKTSNNKIEASFKEKEEDLTFDEAKRSLEAMGCTCK